MCAYVYLCQLCEALTASFLKQVGHSSGSIIPQKAEGFEVEGRPLVMHPLFCHYLQTLTDWNWVYGKSPEFSREVETRFEWGSVVRIRACYIVFGV